MALSKQAKATRTIEIWMHSRSRKQIIEMLMSQLEVSKAHASTMYQTGKTRVIADTRAKLEADAYIDSDGLYRWKSSDNIPPKEILIKAGMSQSKIEKHEAQTSKDVEAALEEYRKNYTGPSEEDMFEMRAAFGRGATVVNVLTGKRFTV